MTLELIPVIEIGYNNQGIAVPNAYPYWDNPEIWDKYNEESYQKAGFLDKLIPYLKGSSFYRLSDISDDNLKKLTIEHTQELQEQSCSFFGGYVLKINGQDKLFPQCCGLLADIKFWDKISSGQESYYEGHPAPRINFKASKIILDLVVEENDESFEPYTDKKIILEKEELKKAVQIAKEQLKIFALRLEKINLEEKLGIIGIADVLIWDDTNL